MKVGLIGTGAIAQMHARAYKNIGFQIVVCTNHGAEKGQRFADQHGAIFLPTMEEVCRHAEVDFVDVCTFPDVRLEPVKLCAQFKKHILVQKPMATQCETAREMIQVAQQAGVQLGVMSQHRFDDSILFLKKAIAEGRLGRILQADAYVKWYRTAEYYSRPIKGSWSTEGGGALMNQGIHQVDLLLYLAGPVRQVYGNWQTSALHAIESEDCVNALLRYQSGATGVIQASTALWPGYPERVEIHGTNGTAILTGDKLTHWDAQKDIGEAAPVTKDVASGASDPMAISVVPFERQFLDFAEACQTGRAPVVSGVEGLKALQVVTGIYDSCRSNLPMEVKQTE